MRLPIDRRPQEKKKKRPTCNQPGRFRCYSAAYLVRSNFFNIYQLPIIKHVTVHHRKFRMVILDFPTNIDIPAGEADFHTPRYKYQVCMKLLRTLCLIILIYYSVHFPRRTRKRGVTQALKEGVTRRVAR